MTDGLQDSLVPLYSIGSVARMLDISVHTLRMYEREGLIAPYKSSSNQRRYSKADIERLQCIRRAITEKKMSIEGIKHISAMIPCWKIVGCTEADRLNCEAFQGHTGGCWSYEHRNNICASRECRLCEVYTKALDCEQIKQSIIRFTSRPLVEVER